MDFWRKQTGFEIEEMLVLGDNFMSITSSNVFHGGRHFAHQFDVNATLWSKRHYKKTVFSGASQVCGGANREEDLQLYFGYWYSLTVILQLCASWAGTLGSPLMLDLIAQVDYHY